MSESDDKFPWLAVIPISILGLLFAAGVENYRERKDAAAQIAAQPAVSVPDYTQVGVSPAPAKPYIYKPPPDGLYDAVASAGNLHAWDDDTYACAPVTSINDWLRTTNERLANIPGAYAQVFGRNEGRTFTPRGDGTDLMVKTHFEVSLESCIARASESKATMESQIAESKATESAADAGTRNKPTETAETIWYAANQYDELGVTSRPIIRFSKKQLRF